MSSWWRTGLPGKHGLAVLDELKDQPDLEGIPVVMCSAWCDAGLVNRAMASGAFDYVNKPFSGDEVVRRVKAAMSAAEPSHPHELTDEVRRLMREDRLTGLPNRIALQERFEERPADAEATGEPIALLMVRMDGFEDIERWGDASAGDLLVRMLSTELARRIRPATRSAASARTPFWSSPAAATRTAPSISPSGCTARHVGA